MAFSTNPLALSVPDPAFESWLRDSGHLELIDHHSSAAKPPTTTTTTTTGAATASTLLSLSEKVKTFLSLLTINPFSKLTTSDFSGPATPSWTESFFGDSGSYSFPSGPHQARLRVHENVKRYARNYASLFLLFFAASLYQIPLALIALISSLAMWDVFKYCSNRWGWDRYPLIRQVLIRTIQCATAVILISLNFPMAIFWAFTVTYTGTMLHAAFRKLTPSKQPSRRR